MALSDIARAMMEAAERREEEIRELESWFALEYKEES